MILNVDYHHNLDDCDVMMTIAALIISILKVSDVKMSFVFGDLRLVEKIKRWGFGIN